MPATIVSSGQVYSGGTIGGDPGGDLVYVLGGGSVVNSTEGDAREFFASGAIVYVAGQGIYGSRISGTITSATLDRNVGIVVPTGYALLAKTLDPGSFIGWARHVERRLANPIRCRRGWSDALHRNRFGDGDRVGPGPR